MKYITITLSLLAALFFVNCEGPEGPQGPLGPQGSPGLNGLDGAELLTQIYEIGGIDFNTENGFSYQETFADNTSLEILDTDLVLIYRQSGVIEGTDEPTWELLPAIKFFDEGTLQYKFDHTSLDFVISITSSFPLNDPDPTIINDYLNNQAFKIAIVPAEIAPEPVGAKNLGGFDPFSYKNISRDALFIN